MAVPPEPPTDTPLGLRDPIDGSSAVDNVDLECPQFRPDPSHSQTRMQTLQRELAMTATFTDEFTFTPSAVATDNAPSLTDGLPPAQSDSGGAGAPVVVGVDQAFLPARDGPEEAVSAAVAIRNGAVIEYASARTPVSIPYIPGLLAFREGESLVAALDALTVEPDLIVCDGSGRIHFREAGIATHIGVLCDVPSVGVAKRLLCGTPAAPTAERPAGWRTPIRADDAIETVSGDDSPVIGYAYQSRQYPNSRRITPLYLSPGHRVSAATTVALVEALCAGYKLPEPTRLADAAAAVVKRRIEST